MTVCVASVCDDGKSLVLVADKMVGIGYITSEPDITKLLNLHKSWWVLFAGDPIASVFNIVEYAKKSLAKKRGVSVDEPITLELAEEVIQQAFHRKRMEDAEALYLKPIGWDIGSFNLHGNSRLPNFGQIQQRIDDYSLPIELLVAGFSEGKGHIFSLSGYGESRGIPTRHDVPGFYAVGSGSTGAVYMMYYRDMSSKMTTREAMYYAFEAKYFGEQASDVGQRTDMYLATCDGKWIPLEEENFVEGKLVPICRRLQPKWLGKKDRAFLNSVRQLTDFGKIKDEPKKGKKKPGKPLPTPSSTSFLLPSPQ